MPHTASSWTVGTSQPSESSTTHSEFMFNRSAPSGRPARDVYDDRYSASPPGSRVEVVPSEARADDVLDATAGGCAPPAGASRGPELQHVESQLAEELQGMQQDIERHFGSLTGSLAGRGASMFDALFGAFSRIPGSFSGSEGMVSSSQEFRSSSRIVGPDGEVQEKTVTTTMGPDGVATARSVVLSPDGEETVKVTRGEPSDNVIPPFATDATMLLGPLLGAAMGAWQDVAERQSRLGVGLPDVASQNELVGAFPQPTQGDDSVENPPQQQEAEPWRFGRAARRAWSAFREG